MSYNSTQQLLKTIQVRFSFQRGSYFGSYSAESFLHCISQSITSEDRDALVRSLVGAHNCQHAIWRAENISNK